LQAVPESAPFSDLQIEADGGLEKLAQKKVFPGVKMRNAWWGIGLDLLRVE
jgi:hypothetical protein